MKVGHSLEEILKRWHRLVSLTTDSLNRQLNQSCNHLPLTKQGKEMTYVVVPKEMMYVVVPKEMRYVVVLV